MEESRAESMILSNINCKMGKNNNISRIGQADK